MMKFFTSRSYKGIICNVLKFAVIILLTVLHSTSYAQTKVYANTVSASSGNATSATGCGLLGLGACSVTTVDNPLNAITSDENTFATVKSSGGIALGILAYSGELEIKFPSNVAANTTSYIRIDFDPDILNALLGGNLGGLLANVVGNVALGNHSFEVGARNSAGTTVLSGSSTGPFSNNNLRLVKDGTGKFYVAITPNQIYDRVFIKDITNALLLGSSNNTKVYYAFHASGTEPCAPAFVTGFSGTGISLDALRLGNSGVINSERAIDADPNNFSQISLGILAVGGTASQDFYFTSPSNAGDDFNLRFKSSPALLTLGLLNNISVTAYNGNTPVFTQALSPGLLNLDLLTLLNNGSIVSIPLSPGQPFDRVRVTLGSLVDLNLTQTIDVYGVTRSAGRPTFTAPASNAVTACFNAPAVLRATTPNTNELIWYEALQGGTALATVAFNGAYTTPALTANKTYYVAARRLNCTEESARVPVAITVNPQITFAGATLTNATIGSPYNRQINVAIGGTPGFTYALASGSTLPAGLSLSSTGTITGTPTVANIYNFSIVATDTRGCTATAAYTLTVTGALILAPGALPNGVTGTVYPTQTIPVATGGTGPYTYTAVNLPPGLSFDPATRTITGTPTTPGNYTVPVTVTDANGNTVTSNYTIKITNPFILPAATLANGTTGTVYTPQTIPAAIGGTTPYTYSATGLPPGLIFNPTTRAITGTPTVAGPFTVAVTATDADGNTATTNYPIIVTNPLVLASIALSDGTENIAYSVQTIPLATGGTGPYIYQAVNVPQGLTFNPITREISGTPTQAGNSTIAVTVTDAEGRTVTTNYPIKINGTVTLPSSTLPNGVVGNTYPTQTLPAATGGTGSYSYAATNLPAGLAFNPTTRQITGTPTLGGTYSVSVTATDGGGSKAVTTYNITVTVNAPVVASATVCSGSGATLNVSNVQSVTYNLYGPTGSAPISTNTTGTFITPAVTSQTTFYVEAVSGTAVSSKTAVVVSVNPPATLASVTTSNQVVNAGQTTTLTATADAGNSINWFDTPTAGNPVAVGGSFTTPPLTVTTTYYVQTSSAAGCVSESRVPVTVTVITGGGNTACNAANSQNTGINGICLLCSITGAGNSTDANADNFTRISLAVGVGATGFQQLIFPTAGVATDSIRLSLGLPSGLADVGVLNNITITVLNGTTVVRTVQINNALLNLSLLGGSRFNATLLAGGVYDRVQVSFGATVSALSSLDIYGATVIYPNPTITSAVQNICAGSTATLTATANGGTTLAWFDAPVGGTQVGSGTSFTTNPLAATTTFYIQVGKNGCLNEVRVPVVVTVNPAIVFTGTTLTNPTIGFAYNQQLPAASGGTPGYTYTLASGSTLPAGLSLSASGLITGTPTATGSPTISVVVTDAANCNATAVFNLAVTPTLALAPGALPDGVTGTTYPTQTIPSATGGTEPYTYSASGLPAGLTFNATTREITGIPTQIGNYTIPVTVTDANGNAFTANYTLKVTDPLVLPPATLASGTRDAIYPTQTIPAATGGTMPYTYSATNLPAGLAFDATTREISGTPTQSNTFSVPVTVTDATGKTATTNYSITIIDPLTLPPATLANGNENVVYPTETLPAATGGVGPYTYVAANLPAGLTFDAAARTISGTPTQAGNYVISLTVTDSQGRTASNNYGLTVIGTLNLPSANLPNGTVGVVYPTQTLPAVSGGTGPYSYVANNLPPGLNFNTTTREITGTPTLGGTYTISLTANDANGNAATTGYSLIVNVSQPVVANATVCSGSPATLSVINLQVGVTYNWYGATGNTPLVTNNNGVFITPAITSQTVFYVEAVSGTAVSARTAVNVSVNPPATLATVTTNNQVINAGQSTTLLASANAGNTIAWFDAAAGGNQVGTGTSFVTPALSANTTYYVETTNGDGCVSASRVPVTVTVIPTSTGTACNAANSQNSGITGLCLLCGISGPGNSTDADVNNFTRITLAVGVASTGFQQLIFPTVGTAADSVRLDLALPGGLLDLQVLNNVTINILNGTTLVSSTQLGSSLLNLQLLSGNRFAATLAAGAPFDRVEVRFGALVSAVTSLDIYGATIKYPGPTITAGSQTICAGNTATLTATANGGTTLAWYNAPTGGTQLAVGETFTTPALTTTTTYYIQVSRATCPNTDRIPVTVTVTPILAVPVVATAAAGCAGSSATLAVTNPIDGVTYNWYDAATGGNILLTGATVITPALTANITYYVEAVQGNCVSPGRATVAVSVNSGPSSPMVTASASSVAPGQTAILTATSTDPTDTFNWYSSANATTPIFTGATYVTPPLTVTTSYFVESVSANGCASINRVQITVVVNNGGNPSPVPCESATAQTNGVTGIALLAGVFNPGLAIDSDTQTASSLVLPVGALNASVFQRASFGSVSTIGDTVRVLVSSPGRLLSLGLLSNAQVTSYLGVNSNGDSRSLNNNLLNVQLLSGDTQALITFVPTTTFDAVEVRLNSGIAGVLTSLNFNYAQRILVAPTVVAPTVTACVGQTTQLVVASPSSNLIYKWYDASGNYIAGSDGIIFTTPTLTGDTQFFVAAVAASGCVSARTAVNVITNPAPLTPELLSPTVNTCLNASVVLQVKNPVVGTTYRWYDSADVYQANFDGQTFTVANITGPTTYKVEAVNSCGTASSKATATINVGSIDVPVITPSSVTISAGSVAVLTATSSTADAEIKWYDMAIGGTLLATTSTYTTPPLFADKIYYAEASTTTCLATARAAVLVSVIPNGTPAPEPCERATTQVNGTTPLAIGGSVINPGQAVDDNVNSGSTLVIPFGLLNSSVFQRLNFSSPLSSVGDTLRVKITIPSQAISLAVLQNLTLTTYQGANSNNDVISISNPLITLNLLTGGNSAILSYVPTVAFNAVELRLTSGLLGALTSVNFDYAQRVIITPTLTATTASVCLGSSTTLNVQSPRSNVTYRWYLDGVYQTGKDGTTFATDPTLAAGTYTYSVTANANGCETPPADLTLTVLAPPAPPVSAPGNPATTCLNSPVTLSVTPVVNVTYNWYSALTGGNLLVANNSSFVTPANLPVGTFDYYVEAVNSNSCNNPTRTKVSITVNPAALPADITITGDTGLCGSATTTLTASSATVTNPIFNWYSDAALTQLLTTGATFTTPAISGTTTFYVTVSGTNKCANAAGNAKSVTITINPVATASDIILTGTTTICGGASVTLIAEAPAVINPVFTWYSDAALTQIVNTTAQFNTPVLSASATYYVTVKGDNRCESTVGTAKSITVTVNPYATETDINLNGITSICRGETTQLSASTNTVTNPVYTWYSNAALTSVVFVGSSFTTPSLMANTTYYVTIKGDNKCENLPNTAKAITVIVKEFGTANDIAVASTQICSGSTTMLMASSLTVTQPVFTWYSDASLTSVAFVGPTFTLTNLTASTTFYVTVQGANRCENTAANAKAVTVTVNPLATTTDIIAGGATNACAGSTTTLTATSPTVINPIFTWYSNAALTNIAFIGSTFITPVLTAPTTYYVTVKGDNKCENAPGNAVAVNVTINTLPTSPVVATTGTNICAGEPTTLTITNAQAGINYEWYNAAVGGNLLFTGTTYTTPVLNATVDYYIQAVSTTGGCVNGGGRVKISVTVNQKPGVPTVNASTVNVCIGNPAVLTVTNPQTGVIYSWFTTPTGSANVATGVNFTTPPVTTNVTYYVEGANGSCISTSRTPININALPVPVAPASVTAANGTICAGSNTVLTVNNPVAGLVYRWYDRSSNGTVLGEGITFTTPNITATTIFYAESIAVGGCASVSRTPVTVTVLPVVTAPVVVVQSTTPNSVTFAWPAINDAIGYEVSLDNGLTWIASAGTTYLAAGLSPDQAVTIIVRAKGQLDCQTSANSRPETGKATNPIGNQVYVPNAFTPNNDGKNDIFLVYGNTIASSRMFIYAQWGQVLYQSDNVAAGWDGTYKGVNQPIGVYVYLIEVQFNDGTSTIKKGTVTLLR